MARQRPNSLSKVPSPEQLEREARVLELRQAGLSFRHIAEQVGYANPSSSKRAFDRALARVHFPQVMEARELEAARLDRLQAARWAKALKGDDDAFDQVVKIIGLRMRLLGLTAADGIAEREARVSELQAALVAQTIRAVVEDLPLTEPQKRAALSSIASRVAGITEGDVANVPEDDEGDLIAGRVVDPNEEE